MSEEQNLLFSIWLAEALGPGSLSIVPLVGEMETAQNIYENRTALPSSIPLREKERKNLEKLPFTKAEQIWERCQKEGIGAFSWESPFYSRRLLEISGFPPVLYYRGDLFSLDECISLAVVGTRNPTPYAKRAAHMIAGDLTKAGALIVSGLAVGIDAIAHFSALEQRGKTVAVMGCGLDIHYPQKNERLRGEIEEKGMVFSEFPPGAEPSGWHFPIRNRIISGLAEGVFVVEGSAKSGALTTASHAAEQGRDVFALPGSIFNEKADGPFSLIRDGAIPVRSALDILGNYVEKYPQWIGFTEEPVRGTGQKMPSKGQSPSSAVLKERPGTKEIPVLDGLAGRLYEELLHSPRHVDDLAALLDVSVTEVLPTLTEMEMEGYVLSHAGRIYQIKAGRRQ